jgi:hypothetical protein
MSGTLRSQNGQKSGTLRAEMTQKPGHIRCTFDVARIVAINKCPDKVSRNVSRLKQLKLLSISSKTTFRDTSKPYPEIKQKK